MGKGSRRPSNPGLPVFPGTIIAGKYRVGDLLGEGGMGFVVAATHSELKTKFAIKVRDASPWSGCAAAAT